MLRHCLKPSTSKTIFTTRFSTFLSAVERNPFVKKPVLVFGARYLSLKAPEVKLLNNIYEIVEHQILQARRIPLRQRGQSQKNGKKEDDLKATKRAIEESSDSTSGGSSQDGDEKPDMDKIIDKVKKVVVISLCIYGFIIMLSPRRSSLDPQSVTQTTWSDFVNKLLPTGQISKVIVYPEKDLAIIYLYAGAKSANGEPLHSVYRMGIPSVSRFEAEVRAAEAAINLTPEHWTQIQYRRLEGIGSIISIVILAAIIAGAYFLFKRVKVSFSMSDIMNQMTNTKINVIDPLAKDSKLKIKLKDVAGLHEAKVEVNEFVDYLRNPAKYSKLGAKLPKGALLTGPPGCGKTLLAKALAAECSVPFISMNGTEFVEMIGGLGASRIRTLFKEAKSRAPCIIYMDEIDAIGRKRSDGGDNQFGGGGSGEEEQTLNQLLVEMDGMDSSQAVILIASTNRPDILDKALMRPGRFDRHISVDLPTVLERQELFDMYLNKIKLDKKPESLVKRLSQLTPGFSGADIANVVNEAAIHAASYQHKIVNVNDLSFAMDRILAGPEKRSKTLVLEEREIVAYHESGHALVGWLLEHTDALLKVTIIPRTSAALGFAQYNPKDRKLFSKEELFDRMCMTLGGRAAENVYFNRITTGAQNDLEKVTKQAYAQVKNYGMSTVVGPITRAIVAKAYFNTENIIRDNREKLDILAKALLERETLSYEDVKKLIGPPPFGDKNVIEIADQILPEVSPNE
uniref:AAA+ ATPase domain-containing protein n=1 Tax=Panagrolaimus superbus TaxID=310955 RepID=A0A914YZT0_9BILA